jgi:Tol biopolymer transport system component
VIALSKKFVPSLGLLLLGLTLFLFAACDEGQAPVIYNPPGDSGAAAPTSTVPLIAQNSPPISANPAATIATSACAATPVSGMSVGDNPCAALTLPPGPPTPPLTQNGISVQGIRLEPGNQLYTAAPLKILVKLKGDGKNMVVSAGLRVMNADGQPATYGDSAGDIISMFPSMEQGDWWEATSSAPTVPGLYYFTVESQDMQRQKVQFVLRSAPISVAADPHPLTSGFLISRSSNIYLISADGLRSRQLTFYPEFRAIAKDAVWSPDGKQIAYAYAPPPASDTDEPQSAIWLMNADGTAKRQLVPAAKDQNLEAPQWSPDGKYIYLDTMKFLYDSQGNFTGQAWDLERFDLTASKRQTLIQNAQEPYIGSDGSRMVYEEILPEDDSAQQQAALIPTLTNSTATTPLPAGSMRLMAATHDGSNPQQVIGGNQFVSYYAPKLSPDGKRIVFAAIGGPSNVAAQCASPLLPTPTPAAYEPVNGLAVPLYHGLPWDVWMVNSDGTGLTRLTAMSEDTPDPVWLNDSSHIAFIGVTGLYLLDLSKPGCAMTALQTYSGASHSQLDWRGK